MTSVGRFGKRGTFWSAAAVLALCLWASGAPSVLYPTYAAEWHLSPVIVTSVFAAYPVALMLVLLVFGGLSDSIGRRKAMMLGIALIGLSAMVFAVAPNVGFLFAGRILQGIGTGFALGAAGAALVENNTSGNPRLASTLTTISTASGLTAALLISGFLAQLAPLPMVLSFIVLLVLAAVTFTLIFLTPHDTRPDRERWQPRPIHLPPGIIRPFVLATLSVGVAYAVGAIMLSLGAQMARQLTGTSNLIVIGGLLAASSVAIGLTGLFLGRIQAHLAVMIGGVLSIGGLGLMAATASSGSVVMLLVWCLVGGVGYAFAFTGGLALINRTAPPAHRGGTLSLLYLFAYLLQAGTAVGAGAFATAHGLRAAIDLAAPVIALLCAAAIVLAGYDMLARRRVDAPAVQSAQ